VPESFTHLISIQCPIGKIKSYSQTQSLGKLTLEVIRHFKSYGCIILLKRKEEEGQIIQLTTNYKGPNISKAIFNKKNKVRRLISLDIKT
jgi:hypothetical protein